MKKPLIYTLIGGACLVASTGLTLIANGTESAINTNSNATLLATSEDNTLNITPKSFTANETVYVITDHAGQATKSFVGSTINTSTEPIPVDLHITYTLDGTDITAEDLVGKSGHIKITYDYTATKTYNNKKIPFLTVTGLSLDSHKFTNIELTNGKIINETEDTTLLAGYAIAGLNEDLGLDVLPSSFTLEADVTDFSLDTTYTFATNEIFADLDTDKLNSIDDLIAQINQLSDGMNQLINGSSQLASGLDSATNGAKALQSGLNLLVSGANELTSGAKTLATGANELASGASTLADGTHQLKNGADQLSNGLSQYVAIDNQILGKINEATNKVTEKYAEIAAYIDRVIEISHSIDPAMAVKLVSLKFELESKVTGLYDEAYGKVTEYTGGIEALYDGANQLASGLDELSTGADSLASGASQVAGGANAVAGGAEKLSSGATELSLGSSTLVSGLDQLSTGSHTLYNGLITINDQGISKLVNFANHDLTNLTNNLRLSVNSAKSYHHYQDPSATSVKFLFKTPSIK